MNHRCRHHFASIRRHRLARALLPVEQLITRAELLQAINDVRASRAMWRVVAGAGWAFFFVLFYGLLKGAL